MWDATNTQFVIEIDGHDALRFDAVNTEDKVKAIKEAARSVGWKTFRVYSGARELRVDEITAALSTVRLGPYNKAADDCKIVWLI